MIGRVREDLWNLEKLRKKHVVEKLLKKVHVLSKMCNSDMCMQCHPEATLFWSFVHNYQ